MGLSCVLNCSAGLMGQKKSCLPDGVVSECKRLEWDGMVGGAGLRGAEEVSGDLLEVRTGGISGISIVRFWILLD